MTVAVKKTAQHSTEIDSLRVEYAVRYSRAAKRARIKVGSTGVEVVLPRDSQPERAEAFLQSNGAWLLNQIAFFRRLGDYRTTPKPKKDWQILFKGQETKIEIIEDAKLSQRARIVPESGLIQVFVPPGNVANPQRALDNWLRRLAKKQIQERLVIRAQEMKVTYGRVFIKGQRTRWGSCSGRKNLSFNWRLTMSPPDVLDYIVIHELAHLLEPSHSLKFWLIVKSYCPNYERHRAWLKQHENELQRFLRDNKPSLNEC